MPAPPGAGNPRSRTRTAASSNPTSECLGVYRADPNAARQQPSLRRGGTRQFFGQQALPCHRSTDHRRREIPPCKRALAAPVARVLPVRTAPAIRRPLTATRFAAGGLGGSSNGRTADSDSACLGSNPSPPATQSNPKDRLRVHTRDRPPTATARPRAHTKARCSCRAAACCAALSSFCLSVRAHLVKQCVAHPGMVAWTGFRYVSARS